MSMIMTQLEEGVISHNHTNSRKVVMRPIVDGMVPVRLLFPRYGSSVEQEPIMGMSTMTT